MSSSRKTAALVGAGIAVLVVALLAFGLSRRSSSNAEASASAASSSTTTAVGGAVKGNAGQGAAPGSGDPSAPGGAQGGAPTSAPAGANPAGGGANPGNVEESPKTSVQGLNVLPTKDVPLDVQVSNTQGLSNGQTVDMKVTAKNGALFYGIEARLCRGDADIQLDGDFLPSKGGNCTPTPLAQGTEAYQMTAVPPPNQSADFTFKVGAGSQSWQTQDGQNATLACGPGSPPCQLVLKLQFTNGFGFQSYPLSFG